MKKIVLFALLSFIISAGYAQVDSAKLSSKGPIAFYPPGFFRPGKFYINGEQESPKEIRIMLNNAKVSTYEFNQARKNNNLALYMAGAAIACVITSAATAGNSNYFKTTSSKIFLGLGCGFIIPEGIFVGKRNKHFANAFNLYNQQFK